MAVRRVVPNLVSPDMDASRVFYAEFLGFKPMMDLGWIVTYGSPTNHTAQISISPGDGLSGEQMRSYMTIEVDDVDAVHEDALARGYDIVHPLTVGRAQILRCRTGRRRPEHSRTDAAG